MDKNFDLFRNTPSSLDGGSSSGALYFTEGVGFVGLT